MVDDDFEWNDEKAALNRRKHGVSFEDAVEAFDDAFAIATLDDPAGHGEERIVMIGTSGVGVLTIVYTERGERVRIISARKATRHEKERYHHHDRPARHH